MAIAQDNHSTLISPINRDLILQWANSGVLDWITLSEAIPLDISKAGDIHSSLALTFIIGTGN